MELARWMTAGTLNLSPLLNMLKTLATNELTKQIAFGSVKLTKFFGRNSTASDLYLQLHQSPVVLAGAAPVPLGVLTTVAGQWFDWDFAGGLELSELTVAVSSTEATYTAPATGVSATIEFESDFDWFSGLTVVGDLTTSVANRQVWSDASGPKTLYRLDIVNSSGAATYPYISAGDSPAIKNSAMDSLAGIANGATGTYHFGKGGISPQELQQSGTTFVTADGCTVVLSASPLITTTALTGSNSFAIRAIYA